MRAALILPRETQTACEKGVRTSLFTGIIRVLDDLSGVRARQGGLGVRRAVGLEGVDCLVFSRLKPTD